MEDVADTLAELGTLIQDTTASGLSDETVDVVTKCYQDTLAVTMAGVHSGAGATAADAIGSISVDGEGSSTVIGTDRTVPLSDAVFVNGTAAHGLDYDDTGDLRNQPFTGHPSVVLVPATLGVAEAEQLSGSDVVAAYAVGFTTLKTIAELVNPDHYLQGWHATSTIGVFGATAAVASLLDLDRSEIEHALNLAASMSAGLKQNFGSMAKPMHAGNAARSGVTAALLAGRGFTADAEAVTGDRGFVTMYGPGAEIDTGTLHTADANIGEDEIVLKSYPCCLGVHASIDAASSIVKDHDIAAADVESVEVRTSKLMYDALPHEVPGSVLEAKFSMPYAIASAIARDHVGLETFTEAAISDPTILDLCKRVEYHYDESIGHDSMEARVAVETTDQRTLVETAAAAPGTHDNPMEPDELRRKFVECTDGSLPETEAAELFARFEDLPNRQSVGELLDLP